jgi:hypothetical protein
LRKTHFETAADVADFVVKNMPPGGDSSLKERSRPAQVRDDRRCG